MFDKHKNVWPSRFYIHRRYFKEFPTGIPQEFSPGIYHEFSPEIHQKFLPVIHQEFLPGIHQNPQKELLQESPKGTPSIIIGGNSWIIPDGKSLSNPQWSFLKQSSLEILEAIISVGIPGANFGANS